MKKLLLIAALAGFAGAATTPLTVNINGRSVTLTTTTIGGVSYVKTADLLKVLSATPAGGATQVAATEGCMNQWLFNGVVRFRVQKVESSSDGRYWNVTLEVKNGLTKPLPVTKALGINIWDEELSLTTSDGNTITNTSSGGSQWSEAIRRPLTPGSGMVVVKDFRKVEGSTAQPQKFIFYIDPSLQRDPAAKYTVKDPSFRVDLTCRK